jgi:hypothetical protein
LRELSARTRNLRLFNWMRINLILRGKDLGRSASRISEAGDG